VRRALILLASAAGCVVAGGALFAVTEHMSLPHGVYCGLGTATTVGCDVTPHGGGRLIATLLMLTALPLLGAAFSEMTGHLGARKVRSHLREAEKRIARDADQRHVIMQRHVERLLAGHCTDLKQHINVATGGQRESD
jgi:hypothetical protein